MRDEHRVSEVAAIEFAARCRTERDAAAAIRMCEARENIISKQKRKVVSSTQTTNVEVRGEKITSDKACVVAQRNNKQAETERVVAQINNKQAETEWDDNETDISGKLLLWYMIEFTCFGCDNCAYVCS